jgi:hypothetical protein
MEFTDNPDDQLEDRKLAWGYRPPAQILDTAVNPGPIKVLMRSVRIAPGTAALRFGGTATLISTTSSAMS